jgi:hypothetical protein
MPGDVVRGQEPRLQAVFEQHAPADIAVADIQADAIAGEQAQIGMPRRTPPFADRPIDLRTPLHIVITTGNESKRFHGVHPIFIF